MHETKKTVQGCRNHDINLIAGITAGSKNQTWVEFSYNSKPHFPCVHILLYKSISFSSPARKNRALAWFSAPPLRSLTYLPPAGPDAVEEAEVVDLAVPVIYVQLRKAKVQPVAAGNRDLPLAHAAVVGVRPRVSQRGQRPTGGTEHRWATAITCRVKHTLTFGGAEHITNT